MLINSICNINRCLKSRCLLVLEQYSLQLAMFLNILWKKRLIIGYNKKNKDIKIYLKYNKGVPILKYFIIESKPSRLVSKKLKSKFIFSLISNSWMNLCISDYSNKQTLHGLFFFKLII